MRVLTLYQTNRGGGFFKWLVHLTEVMLKEGWDVHYISSEEFPAKHKRLYFHRVGLHGPMMIPAFARFASGATKKASKLLSSQEFDVIVSPGLLQSFIASKALAGNARKVPIMTFVHGDVLREQEISKGKLVAGIVRMMAREGALASKKIYVSNEGLRKKMISDFGVKQDAIEVFQYNHVDHKKFRPMKKDVRVIEKYCGKNVRLKGKKIAGIVSGLDRIKNIGTLVRAFADAGVKDSVLFIAGSGEEKDNLSKLIRDLGAWDRVFLGGFVEDRDVPRIINTLDLFILPSEYEGYPICLLEVLACETPCIGSDVGGIREILERKELLFSPHDVKALSGKIRELLSDREKLARAGRIVRTQKKRAFSFSWEKEVLKKITANGGAS